MESFAGIFRSSHALIQYFILAAPPFLLSVIVMLLVPFCLDYFSKFFRIAAVLG